MLPCKNLLENYFDFSHMNTINQSARYLLITDIFSNLYALFFFIISGQYEHLVISWHLAINHQHTLFKTLLVHHPLLGCEIAYLLSQSSAPPNIIIQRLLQFIINWIPPHQWCECTYISQSERNQRTNSRRSDPTVVPLVSTHVTTHVHM